MEEARRCPHCMAENTPDAAVCTRCGAGMDAQNAPHQLLVGALLAGRYRVGCCIGEGGFGITYAGWDETLDMKVAVKEYYPAGNVNRYNTQSLSVEPTNAESGAFFERGRTRFLDEARTLARFAYSANIVGVRDCFFENNTAYIVMEFLEGESLSRYLREHGPMPFAQALALLDPVMAALESIHAKGLIHRDISPSNLMLLTDGGVKLLDFGTARGASPVGERSLSVVLKPGYAPEEQYISHGAQGPWSDVYAMSATLYRMITGRTPENALNRMPSDPLPAPSALGADIPPAQERALLHGMAVHASSRIQSMAALRAVLRDGEAAPVNEPEEDEKTLYSPQAAKSAVPEYTPRAVSAETERTERKTAHEPEKPARTAVQDVPPQPEAAAAGTVGTPLVPRGEKKSREMASHAKKTGKKKKKTGWIALAVVLCALIAGAIVFYDAARAPRRDELSKRYQDQTITASMMKTLARDRKKEFVTFRDCSFEDGALEALAKSKSVLTISFDQCSGIETLAPLAELTSLDTLYYDGEVSEGEPAGTLNGEKMFPVEMNCQSIALTGWKLEGGLSFLKNFQNTQSLTFIRCPGMDRLPEMESLKSFRIFHCDMSGCDLSALQKSTQLKNVIMNDCSLKNIDFLADCGSLKDLELDENAITSLRPLSGCANLKTLSASSNQITSLEGLEDKTLLCTLQLNNNQISDLTPLTHDTELGTLELANNNVSDLTPLSDMTELTWLELQNNSVSDLRPLAGNERMRYMYLANNQLTSFDGCENMIELKVIRAAHNQIENLDGLVNVTQLEDISLSDNKLTDISLLAKSAGKLEFVGIDSNDISDISALAGNPEMDILLMENNHISDISALAGMSKLKYLSAYHNEITDITVLGDCKSLYYVDLGENQIADISPLVASAVGNRILLLQNNCITDISTLYRDTDYVYLSLYGNAIEDYSILRELTNIDFIWDTLIVSWEEDMNIEDIGASPYAQRITFVDTPKDKQADIIRTCNETKRNLDLSGANNKPAFLTKEETDAKIQEVRQTFRKEQKADR